MSTAASPTSRTAVRGGTAYVGGDIAYSEQRPTLFAVDLRSGRVLRRWIPRGYDVNGLAVDRSRIAASISTNRGKDRFDRRHGRRCGALSLGPDGYASAVTWAAGHLVVASGGELRPLRPPACP